MNPMSNDANAILLLCGRFGSQSKVQPLEQGEYNQIARWLLGQRLRPADLLEPHQLEAAAVGTGLSLDRLTALINRGVQLGFAVEQWNRIGIWVLCRSDPGYPSYYKSHLREKAPPVLFGAGEQSLLKGGGLAIVGSRNIDEIAAESARKAAAWCASHGMPVISGGARGVDQIAMSTALDAGGVVLGILAENLLRTSVSRDARQAIADGRLLLISPYHPEAGFSVGTAMARNKLIYAMADYGLVVSAEYNKGGTWAGAVEELRRDAGRPVFVRTGEAVPSGNRKLLELGAIGWPLFTCDQDPTQVLANATAAPREPSVEEPATLFSGAIKAEVPPAVVLVPHETPVSAPSAAKVEPTPGVYQVILPILLSALDMPVGLEELAERLDVSKAQLALWLKRAMNDGKVRRLNKPVRYARRES